MSKSNLAVGDTTLREIIEEAIPELAQPRKLGFFAAMRAVWRFWFKEVDQDSAATVVAVAVATVVAVVAVAAMAVAMVVAAAAAAAVAVVVPIVVGVVAKTASPKWFRRFLGSSFVLLTSAFVLLGTELVFPWGLLVGSLGPTSWISQALWRMRQSRRQNVAELPSLQDAQKRVLERMRGVVEGAKTDITGENALVEKRLAGLKAKIQRAQTIKTHFERRLKEKPDDADLRRDLETAKETLRLFQEDLKSLGQEQSAALELFKEIELFIPAEDQRLTDDAYRAELAELRGEAIVSREVSREMILGVILPMLARLEPLEHARQQLLLHSAAALEGPGAIQRLIARAEQVGEESTARQRKLQWLAADLEEDDNPPLRLMRD